MALPGQGQAHHRLVEQFCQFLDPRAGEHAYRQRALLMLTELVSFGQVADDVFEDAGHHQARALADQCGHFSAAERTAEESGFAPGAQRGVGVVVPGDSAQQGRFSSAAGSQQYHATPARSTI